MTTKKPSSKPSSSKPPAKKATPKTAEKKSAEISLTVTPSSSKATTKKNLDTPASSQETPASIPSTAPQAEIVEIVEVTSFEVVVSQTETLPPTTSTLSPPSGLSQEDDDDAAPSSRPSLVDHTPDGRPLGLPLGLVEDVIAWKEGLVQDVLAKTAPEVKAVFGLVGMLLSLVSLYYYLPFLTQIPFVTGFRETILPVLWGFATGALLFFSAYLFSES